MQSALQKDGDSKLFDNFFSRGTRYLHIRRYGSAIKMYELARQHSRSLEGMGRACQMLGIVYRLKRHFTLAERYFYEALSYAQGDPVFTGRIIRDLAMSEIDEARFTGNTETRNELIRSVDQRLAKSAALLLGAGAKLEAAVTQGYAGRMHYYWGSSAEALACYEVADAVIRKDDNRNYELDLLMYKILVVPKENRKEVLGRIMTLIKQTGQYRRLLQLPGALVAPKAKELREVFDW